MEELSPLSGRLHAGSVLEKKGEQREPSEKGEKGWIWTTS